MPKKFDNDTHAHTHTHTHTHTRTRARAHTHAHPHTRTYAHDQEIFQTTKGLVKHFNPSSHFSSSNVLFTSTFFHPKNFLLNFVKPFLTLQTFEKEFEKKGEFARLAK